MSKRGKIGMAVVCALLLACGIGTIVWKTVAGSTPSGISSDVTGGGVAAPDKSLQVNQQDGDAQVTIMEQVPGADEDIDQASSESPQIPPPTQEELNMTPEEIMEELGTDTLPVGYSRTPNQRTMTDELAAYGVSELDPQESSVLKGKVTYDDIPTAAIISGDSTMDDIKKAVVRYIEDHYPTETISSIQLMGNDKAPSQDTGEEMSYTNYLVLLSKGERIGLSVTCSQDYVPFVSEANYLVVNPSVLYRVDDDEYIQMDISETDEEPIPPGSVIDH